MRYMYEPYILRRFAEDKIFFVNSTMPFEYFVQCFQMEFPFFLVTQFEDGRLAISPNTNFIPWSVLKDGEGLLAILPREFEYVTMKKGTFPFILTAHPVMNVDEWLKKFARFVATFTKQTVAEYIAGYEFRPFERELTKKELLETA